VRASSDGPKPRDWWLHPLINGCTNLGTAFICMCLLILVERFDVPTNSPRPRGYLYMYVAIIRPKSSSGVRSVSLRVGHHGFKFMIRGSPEGLLRC
jgi:hypothetical protein